MANRAPVKSLHPLTDKQQEWLWNQGSSESGPDRAPWWVPYFKVKATEYQNPYAQLGTPVVFGHFVDALRDRMHMARTDRALWRKMAEQNEFPTDLDRSNPYRLPEYLSWWQAENAFRRGYSEAADDSFYSLIKDDIREAAQRHRGVVTSSAWAEIAEAFEGRDPVAFDFFMRLQDDPPESLSLKKLTGDLAKQRDLAYQQFSPHYQPLRSVTGAGFFGFGRRR